MIAQLYLSFAKIGLFAFGGGYAMIPLLEKELIHLHHWMTRAQFLDAVAISQVTPGPIATTAAAFVGLKQAGFWGATAATLGVTTPSVVIVWALAKVVLRHQGQPWLQAIFKGVRPVVAALVVVAAAALVKASLPDLKSVVLALATVVAVKLGKVHPILAVLGAGCVGLFIF